MSSLNYCQSCFKRLLAAETLTDEMRLNELMASWSPRGPIILKIGICARCGIEGEVLHYETIS